MATKTEALVRPAEPFLKWAGGKSQLLNQFAPLFPEGIKRYFEPFIGSAAVFFDVQNRYQPRYALLSDTNDELVNCYTSVRDEPKLVVNALRKHQKLHQERGSEHYYAVRALDTASLSSAQRAARLIYLNKTCFNGLYRVNSSGQFNVPMGRYKNPTILNEERLHAASSALKGVRLAVQDFSGCLGKLRPDDYVYVDPPYVPLSSTSNFTGYTKGGFDLAEQERLASFVREADRKGCRVMVSNSETPTIRRLYKGLNVHRVMARRMINSNSHRRGPVAELVITNYETPSRTA